MWDGPFLGWLPFGSDLLEWFVCRVLQIVGAWARPQVAEDTGYVVALGS